MEKEESSKVDLILGFFGIGLIVCLFIFLFLSIADWNFMRIFFLIFNLMFIYIMLMNFFNKRMNKQLLENLGKIRFIALNLALLGLNILFGFINFLNFINWNAHPVSFFIVLGIVVAIFMVALVLFFAEDIIRKGREEEEIHVIKERKK